MKIFTTIITSFFILNVTAQTVSKTMFRLPDTGQKSSYTNTFGEDNDYSINTPFYINNGNGTIIDTVTGLMWQQTDGGEMTIENTAIYCDTLTLGGFTNWRLPTAKESFSILNHQNNNPAIDINFFTKTAAEYWWTSEKQNNDANKILCTNAGGGIGNHPKTETISAGGTKKFHVRAVRDVSEPTVIQNHFTDNGNGTITDNITNLVWQKVPNTNTLTWGDALDYAEGLELGNNANWRLPNIKEIQSISEVGFINPSVNTNFFTISGTKKFWSSTSLPNQTTKAWYWDTQFGITTYDLKTNSNYVICVSSKMENNTSVYNQNFDNKSIQIYPNPFTNKINILKIKTNTEITLFNGFGQIIYEGKDLENQDLTYLSKGVYFIKIEDNAYIILKQ
jgi:hypothetical protein